MNYIGSKLQLIAFIENSINHVIHNDHSCKTFCDLFAGTGIVGSHFKKLGYKIIANDLQYYAYILNKQLIWNHQELMFKQLENEIPELVMTCKIDRQKIVLDFLSSLQYKQGFIYKNYSPNNISQRMYLTPNNAMKCDAIRQKIEDWKKNEQINENEYFFLIASLLKSVDNYANVVSVYGAYLKKFKSRALKDLILEPYPFIYNDIEHEVYNEDANQLIHKISSDILYLDPPYNKRQYATNYHLLETIARYDNPKIYGKTGLRPYFEQKSLYCSIGKATDTFHNLIRAARSKYIFLSYNNEGIIPIWKIEEILREKGEYGCFSIKHTRYKADAKRTYNAKHTIEYLHYCKCN